MHIILFPYGGLANRMRAIDSAVNMCREKDKLSVWWVKDWGLNCDFSKIYKPVPFIVDKSMPKYFRRIFKYYERSRLLRLYFSLLEKMHILLFLDGDRCLKIKDLKNKYHLYLWCIIRTWEAFYPQQTFHNELFVLQNSEKLAKEYKKIDQDTVGIHIRRTDNTVSIENSPLEVFEKAMDREMSINPNTNFYLCSDDKEIKDYFQKGKWSEKVKVPDGPLSRDSEEGIIQAACELYALSKTRKILGSYWSSFGEIAAKLGNIEIEICTTLQS
jgi:hypothetical protein